MKKGFTLAEVLVTLAVLGVIGSILIPTLFNAAPNKNKVKFKKSYYALEKAVQTLANDTSIYPSDTNMFQGAADTFFCQKFANLINTISSENCAGSTVVATTVGPTVDLVDGTTDTVNTFAKPTANYCLDAQSITPAFTTPDGAVWWGLKTSFSKAATPEASNFHVVCVDVDGKGGEAGIPIGLRYDGKMKLSPRGRYYTNGNDKVSE